MRSFGPDRVSEITALLDRQFQTLHNRAQVLLGICGILISASVLITTGKIVGRVPMLHQRLAGAVLFVAGVLEIGSAAVAAWILSNLAYRDRKAFAFRVSLTLVVLSMMAYQTAITVAVLDL